MNEMAKKNKTKIKRAIRKARKEANDKHVNSLLVAYETLGAAELVLDPFRLMKEAEDYWNYRPCCEDVLEFIDAIVANGEDINFKSEDGYGLLHVFSDDPDVIKAYAKAGGDINLPLYNDTYMKYTYPPLHCFVQDRAYIYNADWVYKILKLYLDLGADPNQAFLLHKLVIPPMYPMDAPNETERVKLMNLINLALSYGADINLIGPAGDCVLERVKDSEIVKFLLEKGANPNDSSLRLAVGEKDENRVIALLKGGADPNLHGEDKANDGTPLFALLYCHCYTKSDREKVERLIRLMVQYGADLNAKNCNGETLLTYRGVFSITFLPIRLLLELGADANYVSPRGNTPLHSIIDAENLKTELGAFWIDDINALIEYGINVNAVNNKGKTAFGLACDVYAKNFRKQNFCTEAYRETLKILVRAGADIDSLTKDGKPAIETLPKDLQEELIKIAEYRNTVRAADNVDIDLYER